MAKVTFDGVNRLIVVNTGITLIDVQVDLYSDYKEWVLTDDNSKYAPAFKVVGGESTLGSNIVTPYFFLLNGWRVRPQEATHVLQIDGILLVDGGGEPVLPTIGNFNVLVRAVVPIRAETVVTSSGGGGGGATAAEIWTYGSRTLTQTIPTANDNAIAVWANAGAATLNLKLDLLRKISSNKMVTDPTTGTMTVYDDDGVTPFLVAQLYENVSGTQPYRGQGAERREKLT